MIWATNLVSPVSFVLVSLQTGNGSNLLLYQDLFCSVFPLSLSHTHSVTLTQTESGLLCSSWRWGEKMRKGVAWGYGSRLVGARHTHTPRLSHYASLPLLGLSSAHWGLLLMPSHLGASICSENEAPCQYNPGDSKHKRGMWNKRGNTAYMAYIFPLMVGSRLSDMGT